MFLKSLAVRGFKSFAEKTTLVFEPGITIVVGPNGSGKSNIVDAISWVLGEQGPRSLRGGRMEDVIFAGSPQRPALAMAEVALTIDNSAGLLPIGFSEVTISRALFRSGESEYRLNGAPCRLLDIQEILSDTGVGREQHTIVGQGQLDQVLNAGPEQLRGFIEEAAGVGKHRRRRERAARKIAATEQNIVRLSDLLAEVRRQLRPLREQADVAKKHARIADELAKIRLISMARALAAARTTLGGDQTGPDLDSALEAAGLNLGRLEERAREAEDQLRAAAQSTESAKEATWSLARSAERLAALGRLAEERARSLEAELAVETETAAQARVEELRRRTEELERSLGDARAAETLEAEKLAEEHGAGREGYREAEAVDEQLRTLQEIVDSRSREVERLFQESVQQLEDLTEWAEAVVRNPGEASLSRLNQAVAAYRSGAPRLLASFGRLKEGLAQLGRTHQESAGAHLAAIRAADESKERRSMTAARRAVLEESLASAKHALDLAGRAVSQVAGRRRRLAESLRRAAQIARVAGALGATVASWAATAGQDYESSRAELQALEQAADGLRADRITAAAELDQIRIRARQQDLSRGEHRLRARMLEEQIRQETGSDPDLVVTRFGHRWEIEGPALEQVGGLERLASMEDEFLERRAARLERELEVMGRVNPLASQEAEALAGRESYLSEQLADLRASRRDLAKVVNSVDERIEELFSAAYAEVASEFERLFAMLFPGGKGRLTLTDPSDLLSSGVEVEARPGGKNLKRLSLLSGGERSLSALAVLFSIFRARPSPFYILDEVEAALDDVNLHRFLGLLAEFRESSQLLVVTHQKRTMEVADVLYGVSIGRDGASKVISERLAGAREQLEGSEGRFS